jgi:hypothetical protein
MLRWLAAQMALLHRYERRLDMAGELVQVEQRTGFTLGPQPCLERREEIRLDLVARASYSAIDCVTSSGSPTA